MIDVNRFINRAVEVTGLAREDILGGSRRAEVVRVRFAIIYAATRRTTRSYSSLGRILKRDHSSIINAEEQALRLVKTDADFARLCRQIENSEVLDGLSSVIFEGLELPVCLPVAAFGFAPRPPGLSWAVSEDRIYLMISSGEGAALAVQMDEHQLYAMAGDLAEKIQAMPPRPENERALQ